MRDAGRRKGSVSDVRRLIGGGLGDRGDFAGAVVLEEKQAVVKFLECGAVPTLTKAMPEARSFS